MLRTRARSEATGTEIRVNGGAVASVREVGTPEGIDRDRGSFLQPSRPAQVLEVGYGGIDADLPPDDADGTRVSVGRVHADERHANAPPVPPANGLGERFFQLFGERPDLIEVRKEAGGLKLQGYIAALGDQGPACGPQNVFVNRRIVKDRTIAHAIGEAYSVATIKERSRMHLFIEIPRTAST